MIKINLLPIREIKRRQTARKEIIFAGFGIISFILLLGLIGLFQLSQAKSLEANLLSLQAEKQKYDKILEEIKLLEADKATLENQIKIIDQLKASSSLTVHVLDDVANLIPDKRIWLTALEQTGMGLIIQGMALDNQTIAKFMDDLRKSAYIGAVSLTDSTMKSFAERELKAFSLQCQLITPSNAEEKTN